MRDLIDLFEAPAQGKTGAQLAKTSGGQFMNRADRTNQAKVDAALGGTVNPATGKPYVAGTAAANMALAKKFSQPQTATAAPAPATNVPAPSAGNELAKGQVIGNAMNPAPAATNAPAPSAGNELAKGQVIGNAMNPAPVADTRGAAAMASKSAPAAPEPAAAPAQTSDQIATQALNAQDNTPAADTRGAAAMASKSAPAQTSDQIATAALNAQDNTPAADTRGAAAMASKSAPAQTSDQIATQALNTQNSAPAADVRGASAQRANPVPTTTTTATTTPTQNTNSGSSYTGDVGTASNNPAPKSDYQPVAGSSNLVSRTPDKIAADNKAGLAGQNQATKSYGSAGEFFGAIGDKFKSLIGGNKPVDAMANSNAGNQTSSGYTATPAATPAAAPAPTAAAEPSLQKNAAFGQVAEEELEEADVAAQPNKQATPKQQEKLPSMYDVERANKKEIEKQFTDKNYVNPHNKDTTAIGPGSKSVNTMADFEESVDRELAEMLRLSGLPIMEKAVSRQQQKFMGMVHAMQKGKKVKGASSKLKKAAKTMSKKDAKDFASTKHKGLPKKVNEGLNLMLDEDGHTLTHIVNRYKHEVRKFIEGDFMPENLYDALYDYYLDRGDLPYGIAKGREGDPYQWVSDRFYDDVMRDLGDGMNETVQQPVVDNTLSELARLAGLPTNEDGPGASMLYSKDKPESMTNKMKSGADSVKDFVKQGAEAYKDLYMTGLGMPPDKYTPADPKKPFGPKKSEVDEDGPGAAMLYSKDKPESMTDKMKGGVVDTLKGIANKGIDWYNKREQEKKDYWDSIKWADGSGGKPGSSGVTADLLPRFQRDSDTKLADKDTKPMATPAATKADALGAASGSRSAQADDKLKENNELNRMRKIAGLQECGDMEMSKSPMQKDRLNVTTNMSSDGTRDVTVNAQGDKADELLQMLKMAGMRSHDDHSVTMSEPEVIMISGDQMMDEERETEYSNTPEEEYQTVDSIIRQGNDLNREKRQYADKPKLGDNPMAESILDQDLNEILESILIRDDEDSQRPIQFTPKSYDPKTGSDWSGFNITSPKTGRIGARMEPGKDTEYYAADPLPPDDVTGATIKNHGKDVEWHRGSKTRNSEVDEGWEDVSNFFGDLIGTEASKLRTSPQLRDLDAMRKQYKGTEYEKQVNDRYDTHLNRLQLDKGEVVDKAGEPIKVLPPDQWKGK